jgi:hypothetical protein
MHKSATKFNETIGKWCKNKHGASKIIDTLETYQRPDQHTKVFCKRFKTILQLIFEKFFLEPFLKSFKKIDARVLQNLFQMKRYLFQERKSF